MLSANNNPWIIKVKPNPTAKLKLFCFPFAGASSVAYRGWADHLPAAVELCALEIPGRGARLTEPLVTHLPDLVNLICVALQSEIDRPFILFGHSMGALTGYEVAHKLLNNYQQKATHMFFSGRGAPHLKEREEPIHLLEHDAFIAKIKEYDGTPREVMEHEELMELMVPIIRADFQLCETYSYTEREPLPIPLTVFGGLNDNSVNRGELEQWRRHTTESFNLRMFPGGHFFLNDHVVMLLQTILRDLSGHFKLV